MPGDAQSKGCRRSRVAALRRGARREEVVQNSASAPSVGIRTGHPCPVRVETGSAACDVTTRSSASCFSILECPDRRIERGHPARFAPSATTGAPPARPARRAGCGPCATALRRCRRKAMRRALPHARLPPLSLSPAVGPENPSSTREPRLARADAARGPLDPALGIVQWGKRASWKQSGSFSCPYISLVLRGPLAPDFGIGRARPGPHRRPLPCLLCPDPGNSEVRASARACARACPCARIRMCFLCVPAACVRVCERAHV